MKLQELLISLRYDEPNIHERTTDEDSHTLVTYKNHKCNTVSISLSYLLFSTDFLSLLEWINTPADIHLICGDYNMYRDDGVYGQKEQRIKDIDYHKINLVLLNTDAERIEYIESFTL